MTGVGRANPTARIPLLSMEQILHVLPSPPFLLKRKSLLNETTLVNLKDNGTSLESFLH